MAEIIPAAKIAAWQTWCAERPYINNDWMNFDAGYEAALDAGARAGTGGKFGTHCPYCNDRIGVFSDLAVADEAGKTHIQSCARHPLAACRERVRVLEALSENTGALVSRLRLALEQHLPPDPHAHSGGAEHVCDAECEEMFHLGELLSEARRTTLPPAAPEEARNG